MKILENFGEIAGICRKIQDNQQFMNNFHRAGKIKKPTSKIVLIWTKNEENIKEKVVIFYQNLYENDFFHNFSLNISWISASSPKVCTQGR